MADGAASCLKDGASVVMMPGVLLLFVFSP